MKQRLYLVKIIISVLFIMIVFTLGSIAENKSELQKIENSSNDLLSLAPQSELIITGNVLLCTDELRASNKMNLTDSSIS
jgi:cytochrome c biogenesis factor